MPYMPKRKPLPWIPKATRAKQSGRKERSKLYNTAAWQRTRKAQIEREPLCASCLKMNPPRTVAATVADHILRYNENKHINFFSFENLQSLCTSCHNSKSARERHGE